MNPCSSRLSHHHITWFQMVGHIPSISQYSSIWINVHQTITFHFCSRPQLLPGVSSIPIFVCAVACPPSAAFGRCARLSHSGQAAHCAAAQLAQWARPGSSTATRSSRRVPGIARSNLWRKMMMMIVLIFIVINHYYHHSHVIVTLSLLLLLYNQYNYCYCYCRYISLSSLLLLLLLLSIIHYHW